MLKKNTDEEHIYHFVITIAGCGRTPEEAWPDATDAFMEDPGECPDIAGEDGISVEPVFIDMGEA